MPEMEGIKLEQERTAQFTKDTFEVNESAALAVRQEIPIGVSGQPIERIPLKPQLKALLDSGTYVKRIASQERCLRLVTLPLQGGKEGVFHCSRACLSAGTDGDKYCPEHDRAMFQPQQDHKPTGQRVFNSASIKLTEAEATVKYADKDGVKHSVILEQGRDVGAARQSVTSEAPVAVEKIKRPYTRRPGGLTTDTPSRQKAGRLNLVLSVEEMEHLDADHILFNLVRDTIAALDQLPAKSIADMKRIVAIQDKLKSFTLEEGK